MEIREVASHVFAALLPDKGWSWSNSGFVARGDGLMVDTHMDVATTRRALAGFGDAAGTTPERLVNTHHNVDHCWGNQLFRGKEILAHRRCAEAMEGDLAPSVIQAMLDAPELPPGLAWFADDVRAFDFSDIEVTLPTRTFEGDLALDLGGVVAELIHVGPAHTAGDVIVHLPAEAVVFAGDILFHQCTPLGWEGTFDGWVAALERILALDPEVIVPGHGPLAGPEGARDLIEYFRFVHGEIVRHHAAGLPPDEAARRIDLGRFAAWTQPERLVFQVDRAYRELRGGAMDEPVDFAALMDAAVALRRHWDDA
ncbi:MAG: MBL fold metallo-hydrolase [Myxococcota bacterium]|nr:MBL fold metallo-hydrolase [Myxococcota bacterium]